LVIALAACGGAPTRDPTPTAAPTEAVAVAPTNEPTKPWTPPPNNAPPTTPISVTNTKPARCSIRVTERAIYVDGDRVPRGRALAICRQRSTALVEIVDEVMSREWDELRAALVGAGVTIMIRGARGHADHAECLDNPLAKGCN